MKCKLLLSRTKVFLVIIILPIWGFAQETRPEYNTSTGFFIKNGKLYDAAGYEFIIRGVNNGHSWHDHPSAQRQAINSLPNIAMFGFNSVRVVWGLRYWDNGPNDRGPLTDNNILIEVLDKVIENKLIPAGRW